ncbi:MAG TPA: 6-phosphogluconolactonase [Dehalococcoidia bacterium]|nr:6-phosphogluconolactonase [Dehalococcoidia bacterium]
MSERDLRVFDTAQAMAEAGAELFVRLAGEARAAGRPFSVALSGGSTPRAMFALLASDSYRSRVDWTTIEFFWSDERAVPPNDPQSNFGMAKAALLDHVPVPAEHVHRMPAEQTPLVTVADGYAAEIRRTLGVGRARTPRLDLVMLGMGPDGHTASLFPETAALEDRHRLVAANHVPKLDADRLTFTPKLINAAAQVLLLVAGEDKAAALREVLEGERRPSLYPAQLVAPEDGTAHWYVDRAAASRLAARAK